MTLDTFITTYNHTKVGSGQCVDLIKQYEQDVLGLVSTSVGDAHQYYDDYNTNSFLNTNFDRFTYLIGSNLPQTR